MRNIAYVDVMLKSKVEKTILKQVKKNKEIVYGAKALNKQVVGFVQRPTQDYDIYSTKPKRSARQVEKKLDKLYGFDHFYTKPAMNPGTTRVMSKGKDLDKGTRDDYNVADYTEKPRKVRVVTIGGVKYAHVSKIKEDKVKALMDPAYKFRHEKDKWDLERIKKTKQWRR